jgi:hypothetical protein
MAGKRTAGAGRSAGGKHRSEAGPARDTRPGRARHGRADQADIDARDLIGRAKASGVGRGPSVAGRTAGGAIGGAGTGAMIGSAIPGVGTAAGAIAGGAVGAGTGAAGAVRDRRAQRRAQRTPQRLLVAEFVACMVILALSPLTNKDVGAREWLKRGSAMCGLFLILGLIGSAGPSAARMSSAFGGLATVALMVDQRSLFTAIARRLGSEDIGPAPTGPTEETLEEITSAVPEGPGVGDVTDRPERWAQPRRYR